MTAGITITNTESPSYAELDITVTYGPHLSSGIPSGGSWTTDANSLVSNAYNNTVNNASIDGYTTNDNAGAGWNDIRDVIGNDRTIHYTCSTIGSGQTEPTIDLTGLYMSWPNTGVTNTTWTDGTNPYAATYSLSTTTTSLIASNTFCSVGSTVVLNGSSFDGADIALTMGGWTCNESAAWNATVGGTLTYTCNSTGSGQTEPTLDVTGCFLDWGGSITDTGSGLGFVDGTNGSYATLTIAFNNGVSGESASGGTFLMDGTNWGYDGSGGPSTNWTATSGSPASGHMSFTYNTVGAGTIPGDTNTSGLTMTQAGTDAFFDWNLVQGPSAVWPDGGAVVVGSTTYTSCNGTNTAGMTFANWDSGTTGSGQSAPSYDISSLTMGGNPWDGTINTNFYDGTNSTQVAWDGAGYQNGTSGSGFTGGSSATAATYSCKIAASSPISSATTPPDGGTYLVANGGANFSQLSPSLNLGPSDTVASSPGYGTSNANQSLASAISTGTTMVWTCSQTGSGASSLSLTLNNLTLSNTGNQLWVSTPSFTDGGNGTAATYKFKVKSAAPVATSGTSPDGGTWSDGVSTNWGSGDTGVGAGTGAWSIDNSVANVAYGNASYVTMTYQAVGSLGSAPSVDFSGLTISNAANQLWVPSPTFTDGLNAIWTIQVVASSGSWDLFDQNNASSIPIFWNCTTNDPASGAGDLYFSLTSPFSGLTTAYNVDSVTVSPSPNVFNKTYTITMSASGNGETIYGDNGTLTYTPVANAAAAFFLGML